MGIPLPSTTSTHLPPSVPLLSDMLDERSPAKDHSFHLCTGSHLNQLELASLRATGVQNYSGLSKGVYFSHT